MIRHLIYILIAITSSLVIAGIFIALIDHKHVDHAEIEESMAIISFLPIILLYLSIKSQEISEQQPAFIKQHWNI